MALHRLEPEGQLVPLLQANLTAAAFVWYGDGAERGGAECSVNRGCLSLLVGRMAACHR